MISRNRLVSRVILGYFLFLLFVSVIPLNGSTSVESIEANIEPQHEFILSSTYLKPGGRADSMVAYDNESDVTIIYGGWDDPDPWELDDTWAYSYNTNTFENMTPVVSPGKREVSSFAYDSQSDLMVLFGGYTDFAGPVLTNETWTYSYNTNTWTEMSPATAPIARNAAGMVYDAESDRMILFGGTSLLTGYYGDTWVYDIESDTWTKMSPATSPGARYFPAMAYDEESDRVILFGGRPENPQLQRTVDDTWAYDFNTDTWTELTPTPHPEARRAHSMVYNSAVDGMVLFGGSDDDDNALRDTWLYDYNSNNWTQASPTNRPPSRMRHRMVYDEESNVVLSFLGSRTTYSGGGMIQNDIVWAYDTSNDNWRRMSPITQKALVDVMMAYDIESDVTIIFGGEDPTASPVIKDQTWMYDLNSDTYLDMSPVTAPSPRAAGGMVYDSQSDRIVQFGGILSTSTQEASGETWIYNYNENNWTNVAPAIAPSARLGSYMTYDSDSDRVILFGGITLQPITVIHNDTWAFDLEANSWEEMSPTSDPAARYGAAITYDSESDRVILFGGNPSATTTTSTFSDTWEYDYELDRWAEVSSTGHPPAGYTGKMAYDSESDKVVFFGGYPDANERNETWTFDLNANLWTQSTPTPSPYGRFRHHMVYDSDSDSVILFGGMTGDWFSEETVQTDTTWSYDTNDDTWTPMSALPEPTPTVTTTPTSPTTPTDGGIPWEIVIVAGAAVAVVIIVVVLKGVVFPKIEGPGD